MKKNEIVHIHSDYKFVDLGAKRFISPHINNTIILINRQDGTSYNGNYKDQSLYFENDQEEEIIEICRSADMVVVYGLYDFKSKIVMALPKNLIIIWCFFGYELYRNMKDIALSDLTKSYLKSPAPESSSFKGILKKYYRRIKSGKPKKLLIEESMKMVDYVMMSTKEEYEYLKKYWKDLPKFMQVPFEKTQIELPINFDKVTSPNYKPTVVIGNSKNIYNNHMDIIKLIEAEKNRDAYKFVFLCNYGKNNLYYDELKEITQDKDYYQVIEDFMPIQEFINFYTTIDALVINGYRQMAMGNILAGLKMGVKVYLNPHNPTFNSFVKEGFSIYNIEDFKKDLASHNFVLEQNIAKNNIEACSRMMEKYSIEEFQKDILKIMGA